MSLIQLLPKVLEESKTEYELKKATSLGVACASTDFIAVEAANVKADMHKTDKTKGEPADIKTENLFAKGDNCRFMEYLFKEKFMAGKIQLIYLDPPFFSKASYDAVLQLKSDKIKEVPPIKPMAYDDRWTQGVEEYLKMLCLRLYFMRDLLAETGSLWLHLDWRMVHPVKLLADAIFGEDNFVNEIIWLYKSGGTGKRSFSRKHDTLLFYSKSSNYYFEPQQEKSYNRDLKPYRFKGVEEFRDETGWYTMVNMKDVWQVDMVGRTSKERSGYATQKPEALLERIIESCTKEGDLCADFFGGSATLAAVAQKKKRRWISCDASGIAVAGGAARLLAMGSDFTFLEASTRRSEQRTEFSTSLEPKNSSEQDLVFSIETEQTDDPDNLNIKITLSKYSLPKKERPTDPEVRKTIKLFEKKDSLQLLRYWSVDFHYDGNIHRREALFLNKEKIQHTCNGQAQAGDTISIRSMDVFGNTTSKTIKIEPAGQGKENPIILPET